MSAPRQYSWHVDAAERTARAEFKDRELSLEKVARRLRISRRHLARLFRSEVGVPFHSFAIGLRMEGAAAALLEDLNRPVKHVALEFGSRDTASFDRDFRSHKGTTPTLWRQAFWPPGI